MAIVQEEIREDPYSEHLFVAVSRRCDRVKILAWDKSGFVLFYKRLEEGRFKLPHMTPEAMEAASPHCQEGSGVIYNGR